jgi:hypothetical protein
MLISQAYPSKYLKSDDLGDKTVRVVMDFVEVQDVGDGEFKPVLYFQGKDRGMVLNLTNANTIAAVYGDETADWKGQELVIYVDRNVMFGAKRTGGLRVRPPEPRDVERDMRDVSPQAVPVRRVANGAAVPAAHRIPVTADRSLDDVPF